MPPRVVIAGSGTAGLACAAALAGRVEVVVFERLPVIGGERWQSPAVAELAERAAAAAKLVPGTQVVAWRGQSVLAVGQQTGAVAADALIVATGHRPFTRAELGISGPRCGGVLPGTVAAHLVHHGVQLGRRPVVIGATRLAAEIAQGCAAAGVAVVLVSADSDVGEARPLAGEVIADARPVRIAGAERVEAVELELANGSRVQRPCDALVLAHGRVPYRNVNCAVFDGGRVVFAQESAGSEDDAAMARVGEQAAAAVLELLARDAHAHTSLDKEVER